MTVRRKECIAMLLAGGQGSRLYVLTEHTAKPAVPFGGKYRIIDYSLSNCVNSGIDTVGILTQYQPLELNDYIGNGQPWDLNRNFGGVHVLPPYTTAKDNMWYKGTANAIYQNLPFIERYNPEYVLILSGDHIYKMDYSKMLDYHRRKNAECTIAVRTVPLSDASRMGIMSTDTEGRITEFEEKPKVPKSNLASMGVYIFSWETLKKYLIADEADESSSNDFGKNVIPALLRDGRMLYAYTFDGYWRDVGTLDSLWQANMDLLDPARPMKQNAPKGFKIYSRNYAQPPSIIADGSGVRNAIIAEGCIVKGYVENSVISTGCRIEEGARVVDTVMMPNSVVKEKATVRYSIIGENCVIGRNAEVGGEKCAEEWGISVVGSGKIIEDGKKILPKEIV
ncbi:MAG: glucose-1-phosphate adenylyltransferase [Firmicutes bacterium]|nr:glucose-1-phosphate adenylyltransferase [Candidatus Colimorpha enterica]